MQKGFTSDPKRCASLPRLPAGDPRRRATTPVARRPARLRAQRRPAPREYFAAICTLVRQPGAGAVQAAHGQAGLLLGLLPRDQARLTLDRRHGRAADRGSRSPVRPPGALAARSPASGRGYPERGDGSAIAPHDGTRSAAGTARPAPPDRHAGRAPWTCQAPLRPTTAVSSSMPSTTAPARRLERDAARRAAPARRRSAAAPRRRSTSDEPLRPADREGQRRSGPSARPGSPSSGRRSPSRPPSSRRSSRRARGRSRAPRRAVIPEHVEQVAGMPAREVDEVRLADRLDRGAVVALRDGADEDRLDLRPERREVLDAHLRPASGRSASPSGADAVGRITTRGRERPVACEEPSIELGHGGEELTGADERHGSGHRAQHSAGRESGRRRVRWTPRRTGRTLGRRCSRPSAGPWSRPSSAAPWCSSTERS